MMDGPEHQMVIAKSTKTNTTVEAGVAFNTARSRRSSEDVCRACNLCKSSFDINVV